MSLLQPCRSALEMHIRRVNYQVFVWVHAHEPNPVLPDIKESGWKVSDGQIEYDWVKGNLIVPKQLVDILCNQDLLEVDNQDDDSTDEGDEFTNMTDEVYESESVEED